MARRSSGQSPNPGLLRPLKPSEVAKPPQYTRPPSPPLGRLVPLGEALPSVDLPYDDQSDFLRKVRQVGDRERAAAKRDLEYRQQHYALAKIKDVRSLRVSTTGTRRTMDAVAGVTRTDRARVVPGRLEVNAKTSLTSKVLHCLGRKIRKEVLFANLIAGKDKRRSPGKGGGYQRTTWSRIKC